ncbi:SigE family RNA polymerase sigma factor [Longispora sp. NPDC051575]|uniref:SigE family RNA polymerase sigma factor n=1 Tax=Longispora sp. NPDC051575 TaxID=3154943 RepID=UPI00343DEDC1
MRDLTDDGFEEFFRLRSAALLRYGHVLTGSPHDAADLTQEALARLREAWPRLRQRQDPEGYVRVTMARLHVSWWRRRRRERLVRDVPDAGYRDGEPDLGPDRALARALAALPPRQRTVLVLRYYADQSDAEIAETLGVSTITVRSNASRALAKLRLSPEVTTLEGTTP